MYISIYVYLKAALICLETVLINCVGVCLQMEVDEQRLRTEVKWGGGDVELCVVGSCMLCEGILVVMWGKECDVVEGK